MRKKSKRAKACDIPAKVRRIVYERDNGLCILCGRTGVPNAHFISRAAGGLGIPENIFTACPECHHAYDTTAARPTLRERLKNYLKNLYDGWSEAAFYYRKGI